MVPEPVAAAIKRRGLFGYTWSRRRQVRLIPAVRFSKYHALGNDYLVLNPADFPGWGEPTVEQIRLVCHRNFGVGSDGILWGPLPAPDGAFGLRIFNPDGSEAEKSGNGLRIFSRFLQDIGRVRAGAVPDRDSGRPGALGDPGGRL